MWGLGNLSRVPPAPLLSSPLLHIPARSSESHNPSQAATLAIGEGAEGADCSPWQQPRPWWFLPSMERGHYSERNLRAPLIIEHSI